MRTFLVTKRGVERVMRTYALDAEGRSITPDPKDANLVEAVPAPDVAEVIAGWHPKHAAEVTATREITEDVGL